MGKSLNDVGMVDSMEKQEVKAGYLVHENSSNDLQQST
jgi:hypothetical protein